MDRFRIPVCAVGAACRGMCGINHKTKHTLSKNPESRPEDGWEKAEAPYSVLPSAAHDKFRSICTTNDLYTEFKFVGDADKKLDSQRKEFIRDVHKRAGSVCFGRV